jgi:transcriptional regulator with GAF, ATPase, and Fis domain
MAPGQKDAETETSAIGHFVSPDGAVLAVLSGEAASRTAKIPGRTGGVLRVGKAPDNDLVLGDATVSRYHLELERTEHGIVVRDLESRNGTFVGGARIREAVVEAGSLLQIGDVTVLVRVELEGAIVPPSASTQFGAAHGRSITMRRLFGLLERVAPSEASVLLMGETGTGKDILARSVHDASRRARGPFEVVDCSAMASGVIESELFGHEKGAFTGATNEHEGAFERAKGGTVFLDELGELPLELQPKLLRVLESRQIRRVGGKRTIDVDVRIVTATTRDLTAEVKAGRFRQDLFFRLAVVTARVPPLRERAEDIGLIAERMLATFAPGLVFEPAALAQLRSHAWPGNARELRNVLERAAVLALASGATSLKGFDLGPLPAPAGGGPSYEFTAGESYGDARARVELAFERQFVAWILGLHDGNIAAAARAAKMDRKYLGDLARKHGLSPGAR